MKKIIDFRNLKWLWCAILFMLLDMGSKYWIKNNFIFEKVLFISSYCNFYYVFNAGLAFGLLSNMNKIYYWLLIWISVLLIIVFIILLCESVKYLKKCYYLAYSMMIGGALGNLFDRVVYGKVLDFVDIHVNNWHWPIFNIADIEICVGVIILIMRSYCIFLKKFSK